MSESISLLTHNWSFAVFLLGVVGLIAFMLGVSSLLGSKAVGRSKNDPFESGIVPTGGARLRLSAKFYLVAMLFVIFDVEAIFMLAWAVRFSTLGLQGLVEMAAFIGVLLVGLVYAWRKGVLRWV